MVGEDRDAEGLSSVQVAVRVRPLVASEAGRGCAECVHTYPEAAQLRIKDFAFSYNYVFPPEVAQRPFYETAVANLVTKLFKGYNVTILAYGQTGSGKTYSMGTSYGGESGESYDAGIIPQAVTDIFEFIDSHSEEYDFKVSVSFIELYQEQVFDLLSDKSREKNIIDIREDSRGIILPGLTEDQVYSVDDTMSCLMKGSMGRATGATAMNAVSSRSHAIFTIHIVQESKEDKNMTTTSKFHLVDLAGSERSKKTKATGNRFKEGVKINQGLLALGNVISALGDGTNRGFICYRESKLTRLLQDSLGGNSVTLMIACISPADYNLEETLSTLRYADRARRIKNKPIVNQDAKAAEIIRLNNLVQQLRLQILGQGGTLPQDQSHLTEELQKVKTAYADLKEKYNVLADKNKNLNNLLQKTLSEHTNMFEKALNAEAAKETVERKLAEITEEFNQTIDHINKDSISEETMNSISEMRSRIVDLTAEQKQCGRLISDIIHENNEDNEDAEQDDYMNGKSGPEINEADFHEKQEAHTIEQVSRKKQFKNLIDSLKLKESLAEKLSENNLNLKVCNDNVQEFQVKITKLEAEKDNLQQQLKAKSKLDPKLITERQNKIQELETEINALKKKCQNQENLIKMKEKNDLKIITLRNEIQQMKTAKVKLLQSMRQENNRFRLWKIQKERQLAKLTDQDRKWQTAIVRMENKHTKQQNVLKRKLEEAVAASKRLKDAMEKHKYAQKQRGAQNSGKTETVQSWVERELELMGSLVAAQRTLEGLMEDRGVLTSELEEIKKNDPDNKQAITVLQDEIQLRSAQIADMQQKILDSEQENKSKMKWDTVQSMVEAKAALKYLFEVAVDTKREIQNNIYKNNNAISKYEELLELNKETEEKLHEKENQIKQHEYKHKKIISQIERNYEEKVHTLTKQLNSQYTGAAGENNTELETRMTIIEDLYTKILNDNELLRMENEELQSKWEKANANKKRAPKPKKEVERHTSLLLTDGDEISEDSDDDPDWIRTPIQRRTMLSRTKTLDESQAVKRTSDGQTRCSCKGTCIRKMCGCRKLGVHCNNKCKCNHNTCLNKEASLSDNQAQSATDSSALTTEQDENLSPEMDIKNTTFRISKEEDPSPETDVKHTTFKIPKLIFEDAENNMNLTNSARKRANRSFFYNNDTNHI